jgi:transposase
MTEGTRKPYPSDLTDDQWNILAALIPPKIGRGENRKVNLREVVNGILYFEHTGCQWDYALLRSCFYWKFPSIIACNRQELSEVLLTVSPFAGSQKCRHSRESGNLAIRFLPCFSSPLPSQG